MAVSLSTKALDVMSRAKVSLHTKLNALNVAGEC